MYVENVARMVEAGDLDHRFHTYPGLFFYLLAPGIALLGPERWKGPDAYLVSRALVATAATLDVALVSVVGARLVGRGAGLIAALLMAVSPVDVRTCHQVRPDILLEGLGLLALVAFRRVGRERRARPLLPGRAPARAGSPTRGGGAGRGGRPGHGGGHHPLRADPRGPLPARARSPARQVLPGARGELALFVSNQGGLDAPAGPPAGRRHPSRARAPARAGACWRTSLARIADGDPSTAWSSRGPMSGDEWLELALPEPARLGSVELWLAAASAEHGPALELELQDPDGGWQPVWVAGARPPLPDQVAARPGGSTRPLGQRLVFEPREATAVRIRQRGVRPEPWSVSELRLLASEGAAVSGPLLSRRSRCDPRRGHQAVARAQMARARPSP